MELSLNQDQSVILDAVDNLCRPYQVPPADSRHFTLTSAALDLALQEGGFLDVGFDPDLGPLTAALVLDRLARLPFATEAATSLLIRPLLGEVPGPVCLMDGSNPAAPVRFLAAGARVVTLHPDRVTLLTARAEQVRAVESLYAYPMAMLVDDRGAETVAMAPDLLRTRWRIALAVEIAALLHAAIDSTVTYVSERKQFGRPLALFQAIRHRLAEASVRANGARWLALRAAGTGDAGDAALAAHVAQEAANATIYDLHQFLGGMGITLEHPLHLWTYRLKALASDLGGRAANGADTAALIWAA
jgi:hypothetical protein